MSGAWNPTPAKPWGRRPKLPRGQVRMTEQTGGAWSIRVPAPLGRMIGEDRVFTVELTDEGILYRFLDDGGAEPVTLPDWLLR